MNLPTALTVSRIFLVPLLLVVLLTGNVPDREFWGLVVFLAAAATDYFDGYLARRREQVTRLGKLLDPLADKILISAALVALVELGVAPAWMVIIVIGREFAVTGLRSIASAEGLTIAAAPTGKLKMVAQVVCCAVLIAGSRSAGGWLAGVGRLLLWGVVVLALVSMWQYFQNYWGRIGETPAAPPQVGIDLEGVERLPHPRKRSDVFINS
ncbi:MAG: hypothetical protein Kow00109_15250 [Acidobacteriota bacterium]